MSNVHNLPTGRYRRFWTHDGSPIDGDGGGPHDPDMEALIRRVDQLEADIRDVKASVGRVEASTARIEAAVLKVGEALVKTREDVAELKGRVSQLPGSLQIVGIIFAVNAGAITLGGLVIAGLKALHIL